MAAVSLQRSVTSFRRQGSSGLVWDEKLFSSEVNVIMKKPNGEEDINNNSKHDRLRQSHSDGSARMMQSQCPTGVVGTRNQLPPRCPKAATVSPRVSTANKTLPPSPKRIGGCGFCGIFGRSPVAKKSQANQTRSSANKRRS
ncbi:uncharacterized protein At1g15400-like [Punica granatum]|uniref:MAPK kinase substrate protein At1g80180-like n=2 Tax=Punica granatum TaxID=22663 RepID=A0A218VZF2_PUNGR|nr:uncharacterized protein At1g15400-like [Punica granatum]OWM65967.1 hypothetical protein CDL15_Pgr015392 [Punica granatum]PKI66737.1 hypothetical protein CRG98_012932 [Punica granatum]